MRRALLTLTSILSATVGALAEAPQEIRVQLATEEALQPIYLASITAQGCPFSSSYLKELEKVLTYDFTYNGKTAPMEKNELKDRCLKEQQGKALGASLAASFSLEGKRLKTSAYLLGEGTVKHFPEIALTGILSEDRQKLHKISDALFKAFFHEEGIASSKILYSFQSKADGQSWVAEIAECDVDGENIRLLTREQSYCITPVAIPGLDLFLYVSYRSGQPKIFLASRQEGKGKRVVDIRGNQMLPAISRKKDKIAFICDASGRTDLFVQPIEPKTGKTGTPQQLFSYPRSTQASPTFSPDGSKIAFVSDKDGAPRIYCVSALATAKRPQAELLTKKSRENSCPSWSPDGTKLAYSAKTEGIRQIWIYDFVTKEERQLTSGPGDKENPCFAENSLHIVFNSTSGANSDLYIVNLKQPSAVKITKGPGKKHYPTWSVR